MKAFWIDLETTGTDYVADSIIELACNVIENGIVLDTYHAFCLPDKKPDHFDETSKVSHGITWDYLVENGISETELYRDFISFLCKHIDRFNKKDKGVFCGYNANFDSNFIRTLFMRNNDNYYGSFFFSMPYDVRTKVAECLIYDKIKMLPNYQLGTVCQFFGIEFQSHSAFEDICATIALDKKIKILLTE
jgi:DNA polymerase-3 subunit epsilon